MSVGLWIFSLVTKGLAVVILWAGTFLLNARTTCVIVLNTWSVVSSAFMIYKVYHISSLHLYVMYIDHHQERESKRKEIYRRIEPNAQPCLHNRNLKLYVQNDYKLYLCPSGFCRHLRVCDHDPVYHLSYPLFYRLSSHLFYRLSDRLFFRLFSRLSDRLFSRLSSHLVSHSEISPVFPRHAEIWSPYIRDN